MGREKRGTAPEGYDWHQNKGEDFDMPVPGRDDLYDDKTFREEESYDEFKALDDE